MLVFYFGGSLTEPDLRLRGLSFVSESASLSPDALDASFFLKSDWMILPERLPSFVGDRRLLSVADEPLNELESESSAIDLPCLSLLSICLLLLSSALTSSSSDDMPSFAF